MNSSNVFDPHSPQARAIFDLGLVSTSIFVAIFAIVAGAIVFSLFRFRWREGEPEPAQFAGHKKTEIIWTVIPLVIVVLLFILTARAMNQADPPAPASPDIVITGHQFWWEARYPGAGVVTANEIHIPFGKAISVRLESVDVLHEFWAPELGRKITAVPGQPNSIWIQADKPGIYLGACSEFCGTQHAWMRFIVVAEEPAKFEEWQRAQLQSAPAPVGDAAKGLALFQQSSCMNCHTIGGVPGSIARVAPDLTHIASRRQLGAGVAENTPETLRLWLADPQRIKPGVLMPAYRLTPDELTQLTAYLETLK